MHDDASHTTGSRPPSVASRITGSTAARIAAYPGATPLEDHGVPQQRASIPSGTSRVIPAAAHRSSNATCTPGPSAGPNITLTQAGR